MRACGRLGRALTCLVVVVACLGAASGSAVAEGQGVTVESVTIDRPSFDVTDGDVFVTVDVGLRSDQYISSYRQIAFTSRQSTQQTGSFIPSMRIDADGLQTFRFTIPFKKGAAPGTWDLVFGQVYHGPEWVTLAAPADQPSSVSVTSENADIDPPVLQSLSIEPGTLSTGYRQNYARVVAHVTDASGASIGAYFHNESDSDRAPVDFRLVSGTASDGTFEATPIFLRDAPAGTWPLLVTLTDPHGNTVPLGSPPTGMPQAIVVTHDPSTPPMPQNPVGQGGDGAVSVTWQPPPNDGGSPLTGYVVALLPERRTMTVAPDALSATFGGLGDGEQHTISVAAVNALGVGPEAANDNPIYTWALPGAPTGVAATPGDGSATVRWNGPAWNGTPVTGFVVTASPGGAQTTVTPPYDSPPRVTFTGLTNRTPYTFTVRALNPKGEGPESAPSAPVVPATRPTAPTMTSVTAVAPGEVRMQWSAPPDTGAPVTRYRLWVTDVAAATVLRSRFVDGQTTTATVPDLIGCHAYRFSVQAENVIGKSPVSTGLTTRTTPVGGDCFTPVAPVRALDTRNGTGARPGKVGPGGTVTFAVPGLPAGARAVALNLTATAASTGTYITAFAAGSTRPLASNLNVAPGETKATFAMVPVSPDGKVTLYNHRGSVSLIADVGGSFQASGSALVGQQPTRVLDTRTGLGSGSRARLGPGGEIVLRLPDLPMTATAVVLNLTATGPTTGTFLTAYPGGLARPTASNLNVAAGQTVANLVTVGVGADRTIRIFNAKGAVDVVADLAGYYSTAEGTGFESRAPTRVLDTRTGTGAPRSRVSTTPLRLRVPGLPAGTRQVALTVTVTGPAQGGYLSVYPGTSAKPAASTLNFTAGQTVSNHVVVPLGTDGTIAFAVSRGSADLVADLAGVFVP
jgi:hypothetical protein